LIACDDNGLIADEEYILFVRMIQDRLLVPKTFDKDLAKEIAARIPEYFVVMKAVLEKIKPQV